MDAGEAGGAVGAGVAGLTLVRAAAALVVARWVGDFGIHPLADDEGDAPNPIRVHDEGVVVFTEPGIDGWKCNFHDPMRGAIEVPAASRAVPSSDLPWRVALAAALLVVGLVSAAAGRRRAVAARARC